MRIRCRGPPPRQQAWGIAYTRSLFPTLLPRLPWRLHFIPRKPLKTQRKNFTLTAVFLLQTTSGQWESATDLRLPLTDRPQRAGILRRGRRIDRRPGLPERPPRISIHAVSGDTESLEHIANRDQREYPVWDSWAYRDQHGMCEG